MLYNKMRALLVMISLHAIPNYTVYFSPNDGVFRAPANRKYRRMDPANRSTPKCCTSRTETLRMIGRDGEYILKSWWHIQRRNETRAETQTAAHNLKRHAYDNRCPINDARRGSMDYAQPIGTPTVTVTSADRICTISCNNTAR